MTPDDFRKIGHRIVDWIADYRSSLAEYPVMSTEEPGGVRAKLSATPPLVSEPFDAILQDLNDILMPGITHWNHPGWYGYFPANASLSSVLGDFLSSGLGVIGLNWQASPALTELEALVTDWMRDMVGLSGNWQGVIQDTASTSSLVALICAREWVSNHSQAAGGMQAEKTPLVVYVSTQSHSSIDKAALLAGFGRDNVRLIDTDENYAMRVDLLKSAIEDDLSKGNKPCAVVATVGTTATTALDPLGPIAELTQSHRMWLHVDAAMAGSAMILPECRWMVRVSIGSEPTTLEDVQRLWTVMRAEAEKVSDSKRTTEAG